MKFVKKNSWEKEWTQTLRQEKQYLQKNRQKGLPPQPNIGGTYS